MIVTEHIATSGDADKRGTVISKPSIEPRDNARKTTEERNGS
jgi:hypothetical protein